MHSPSMADAALRPGQTVASATEIAGWLNIPRTVRGRFAGRAPRQSPRDARAFCRAGHDFSTLTLGCGYLLGLRGARAGRTHAQTRPSNSVEVSYRRCRPRYARKQISDDIRRICRGTCEPLGLRWTDAETTIYVSRKADVATLDRFIGPRK